MLEILYPFLGEDEKSRLKEYGNNFPYSYLKVNESKLNAALDLEKISGIKIFADKWNKKWQDQVGILTKGIVNFSNLVIQERPDTILLLDKSARPVSHFLKSLWRYSYPEKHTPDIRFTNIGREFSHKYGSRKLISQLYLAHSHSLNNKKIIIADEVVEKGDTMRLAKNTIRKVFPNTKRLVFTSVFGADLPFWYKGSFYAGVGVFDRLMPGNLLDNVSEKDEPDSFFSKTVVGVARRHPQIKRDQDYNDVVMNTQEQVNKLRYEIEYLAETISGSCQKFDTKGIVVRPNLPLNLGYLNLGL